MSLIVERRAGEINNYGHKKYKQHFRWEVSMETLVWGTEQDVGR